MRTPRHRIRDKSFLYILALLFGCHTACLGQQGSTYNALIQTGRSQLQAGDAAAALATGNEALKESPALWEAYALTGGALMDLKRYEEAADSLSKAIDKAPATKQAGLRDLRKRCVMAEAGVVAPASGVNQSPAPAQTTTQAEVVLWKSIENSRSQSDFQSYINQYPSGAFVGLAHTHLDQLEAEDKALREQQAAQAAAELERQNVEAQRAYAAGVSYKDSEHHDAVVTASPSGFSLKPSNGRGEIDAPCSDVEWQAEPSSAIVSLRVRIRSTGVKLTLVPYAVENKDFVFYSHQFADALTKYCGSQGERVKLR